MVTSVAVAVAVVSIVTINSAVATSVPGNLYGPGYKERVSRPQVTEAARFAKYAIAAYGAAGYQYLHQTS